MSTLPFAFVVLMGSNCVENNVNNNNKEEEPNEAPELVIVPDSIDFGMYKRGEGATVEVTIQNVGNGPLDIIDIALESDAAFEMITTGVDTTLDAEESTTITVVFTAQSLEHEGQVVVLSTDPLTSRAAVPLYGQGQIPALFVYPDPYDFGRTEPDCEQITDITLENIGTDTLIIDGLAQVGGNFSLIDEDLLELPIALEPGENVPVPISFLPTDFVEYESELWISSNAPQYLATQSGKGSEGGIYEDEWVQPESGKSDVMFYIDQSCSMEDDKERLVANFDEFVDELEELENDYLLMVVTNDNGCHNMTYFEPDTADKKETFRRALDGQGGMFSEAGLTLSKIAMSKTDIGECNEKFNRDGATVSLVLISDEEEQSPPANPWTDVVASILQEAPSTYIHAVAGPLPYGCDTADAGTGYYESTVATGGLFLSICTNDWGSHLVQLAEQANIAKLADTFYLSEEDPEPNSVVVYVAGEERTEGWSYAESLNAIVFDETHIPAEGENILVTYAGAVSCEQ